MKKVLMILVMILCANFVFGQTAAELYKQAYKLERYLKLEQAEKLYKKAADQGYAPAQYRYALLDFAKCYECPNDTAWSYIKRAVTQGYIEAKDCLAGYYFVHKGKHHYNTILEKRAKICHKSIYKEYSAKLKNQSINDHIITLSISSSVDLTPIWPKWLKLYKTLVKNCDATQMYNITRFWDLYGRHLSGYDFKPISTFWFKYYEQVSDSGLYFVNELLGDTYAGANYYYYRVDKDLDKAAYYYKKGFDYYKKLAEAGDKVAQYKLGDFYLVGKGVKQDLTQAYNWYLKSARQNYIFAQFSVAECYKEGKGVKKDWTKAKFWYDKITARRYENLYTLFGESYKEGLNTINYYGDLEYYYSVCDKLVKESYDRLGEFYENGGNGIQQNNDLALEYYEKAGATAHYNNLNWKLHPELKAQAEAEEAARLAAKQQDDGSLLGDLLEIAQDAIEISNTFKNWDWNKSANEPATSSTPTISQESTPAPNNEKKLTAAEIQERNKATILNHKKHIDALHGEAESICKICHGSLKCPKCYGNGKCQDCDNCYFVDGHGHKIGADFSHWEYHIKGYYCRFCKGTTIYDGTECDKCSEVITTPNGHKIGVDNKLWKNDSGVLCTSCHGTMKCSDCAGSGKCQNGTHYRKYNLKDATLSRE